MKINRSIFADRFGRQNLKLLSVQPESEGGSAKARCRARAQAETIRRAGAAIAEQA